MGLVMWHEEESLRELVLLDPITSFVTPATRIICKHTPDQTDHTQHYLTIHKKARKQLPLDFQEMAQKGLVTERLLQTLLTEHSSIAEYVQQSMIKYGLVVPLPQLRKSSPPVDSDSDSFENQPRLLAPALLPVKKGLHLSILTHYQLRSSRSHSFAFVFAATSQSFGPRSSFNLEQCAQYGFYPQGLFERLLAKAIVWSLMTSYVSCYEDLEDCYQGYAELVFGKQQFSLMVDSRHHLISVVMITGNHPLAIHDRLREQITEIISECWKSLKFFTVLLYESTTTSSSTVSSAATVTQEEEEVLKETSSLQLLRLSSLKKVVNEKSPLSLPRSSRQSPVPAVLSYLEVKQLYSPWFVDYDPLDAYDVFISYRWGQVDTAFVDSLFDRLSGTSVDVTKQRPIQTFLDRKRLPPGHDFQVQLVTSLSRSLVLVPIVSAEALHRMKALKEGEEDNTLLEWICSLVMIRQRERLRQQLTATAIASATTVSATACRLVKILPIFFGTRDASAPSEKLSKVGRDLFVDRCIEELSDITIPRRCLELSQQLLTKLYGEQDWLEEIAHSSIQSIVRSLSKYLFLCAWQYETLREIVLHATEEIVKDVNEQLLQEETRDVTQAIMTAVVVEAEASSIRDLTLLDLIELIRKELGISETNKGKVLQLAVEELLPRDQERVNRCSDMKEKAIQILQILGIEV